MLSTHFEPNYQQMIQKNEMPVVSVIMSIYKEPELWIRQSIESILHQSYSDFEFIIVDDCPQREINEQLLSNYSFLDSRIVVLRNEHNEGLTKSLNKALCFARGRYIARMDADDISDHSRFEKQVSYMDAHPEVIVCGTKIRKIGVFNPLFSTSWIKTTDKEAKAELLRTTCFAHPTVMIRRNVLEDNAIRYNESCLRSQDYELWSVLQKYGAFHNLNQKLLKYRISNNQISMKSGMVDDAKKIRMKNRHEWLCTHGISEEDLQGDITEVRDLLWEKTKKNDEESFRILMEDIYFHNQKNKLSAFFLSLVTLDFFYFTFLDKLLFLYHSFFK